MAKQFIHTGKRGRPAIVLAYPKTGTFTANDLVAMNPHVKCRLSIYNKIDEMATGRNKVLRYTGNTVKVKATPDNPTGAGKPLWELQSMVAYRANRNRKAARRASKLASVPPVDLTPAPVAEPVAA